MRLLFPRYLSSTLALAALAAVLIAPPAHAQLVRSAAGVNAPDIQATVDQFRADLGTLNPNVAGSFGSGRREINWDGVPDALSAPNNLPADFFNVNSPRGAVFSTPGSGFRVSADSSNPTGTPVEFADINPAYSQIFRAFSAERLFTPLGSNITDVNFFIPGSSTAALVRGFGVVFSDVNLASTTSLQFFDQNNTSLGTFFAPAIAGSETFSFIGVSYALSTIGRVRITSGNQILSAGNNATDLVVMDDFIYGEPILASAASAPEPGSLALLLPVLGIVGTVNRRRK